MGLLASKCVATEKRMLTNGSEFPILYLRFKTSTPLAKDTKYIKLLNGCGAKSYSPMDATEDGFSLAVKLYNGGKMSEMLRIVEVGDTLSYFDPGKKQVGKKGESVGVLAMGIGITSALSAVERELAARTRKKIVLLFANRTKEDEVFLDRIADLEQKYENFSYVRVLSREKQPSADPHIHNGRLDKDFLETTFRSWDPKASLFHVVGSKPQISSIKKLLGDFFHTPITTLY